MTSDIKLREEEYKGHNLLFYKSGFGVLVEVYKYEDELFHDVAPTKKEAYEKAKNFINRK